VPLYVLVDAVNRRRQPAPRVLGYTLTPDGYQSLAPDERGRLWLAPARTWLGVEANEIVCYDEAGQALGDYRALAAALAQEAAARAEAERRAGAARQALAAAEARVQALEAELRRLRGDES
jgi:hypothetical protein